MLATWTGANGSASWITTRPPRARSITSSWLGSICAQSAGAAAASTDVGVGGGLAGSALALAASNDAQASAAGSAFMAPACHERRDAHAFRRVRAGAVSRRARRLFVSVAARPALTLGHGRTPRIAVLSADRRRRALVLVVAALYVWRDDIIKALLDPKVPFGKDNPPPARRTMRSRAAWALLPDPGADAAGRPTFSSSTQPLIRRPSPPTTAGGTGTRRSTTTRAMRGAVAGDAAELRRAVRRGGRRLCAALPPGEPLHQARRSGTTRSRRASSPMATSRRRSTTYLARFNHGRPFILVGVEQGGDARRAAAARGDRARSGPARPAGRRLSDRHGRAGRRVRPRRAGAGLRAARRGRLPGRLGRRCARATSPACSGCSAGRWSGAPQDQLRAAGPAPAAVRQPAAGLGSRGGRARAAQPRRGGGHRAGVGRAAGLHGPPGRRAVPGRRAAGDAGRARRCCARPATGSSASASPGYNLFWADLEADTQARLAAWQRRSPGPSARFGAGAGRQSNSS